jgi:hypothetical protein
MRRPRGRDGQGLARRETVCDAEEERDQQKPEDGVDEDLEARSERSPSHGLRWCTWPQQLEVA